MTRTGFIGLGTLGKRIVRRLLNAGPQVTGYKRTSGKIAALTALLNSVIASPAIKYRASFALNPPDEVWHTSACKYRGVGGARAARFC